jgi:protein SCO1/2
LTAKTLRAAIGVALLAIGMHAQATRAPSAAVANIGIDQRLGATIPLAAPFADEHGTTSSLARFLDNRPAVLLMGYNACPNLCSAVRASLVHALDATALHAGTDYSVLAVSIDPGETAALGARTREATLHAETLPDNVRGWHFLTGDAAAVASLAQSVGFRYAYDAEAGQFVHAAAIMILTPRGTVSRYFLGIDYPPAELQRSLGDAAGEHVASPVRALLLRCFHYDPQTGRYSLTIEMLARALGAVTCAALVCLILVLRRAGGKDRKRPARAARPAAP